MKIICSKCGYWHDNSIITVKNSPLEKFAGTIFLHKAEFILMDEIDGKFFYKCPRLECGHVEEL